MGGRRRGGGGSVSYTPNVGLAQQNINAQNQAKIYNLQKGYLDFNRGRTQTLNEYQNQLNNSDFTGYGLQGANSAEKQQAALNAVRGTGQNSTTNQDAYLANLKAQADYRDKINSLVNAKYDYSYSPTLEADGYRADDSFAAQQRAKASEIDAYVNENNKSFGDSVNQYYADLNKRVADRSVSKDKEQAKGSEQAQAQQGLGVSAPLPAQNAKVIEAQKKGVVTSPLAKKNFFQSEANTNDVGVSQGYGGQSNSI